MVVFSSQPAQQCKLSEKMCIRIIVVFIAIVLLAQSLEFLVVHVFGAYVDLLHSHQFFFLPS